MHRIKILLESSQILMQFKFFFFQNRQRDSSRSVSLQNSNVTINQGTVTLIITTLSKMTFCIKGLFSTLRTNYKTLPICSVSYYIYCYAECRYAECYYSEWFGAMSQLSKTHYVYCVCELVIIETVIKMTMLKPIYM